MSEDEAKVREVVQVLEGTFKPLTEPCTVEPGDNFAVVVSPSEIVEVIVGRAGTVTGIRQYPTHYELAYADD